MAELKVRLDQALRETRNALAHDYEEDAEVGAASLNLLHRQAGELLAVHEHVVRWVVDRERSAGA